MTITPQTVAALAEKATPGPWQAGRADMATIVDGVGSKWIYAGDKYCAVASGRVSDDWSEVMANAALIAAAPDMAALIAAQAAEIEMLRGLMWYAWHEFNAIRARSGAPLDQYGMTTVATEYWDQMTKAFKGALPVEDQKPWPPEYTRHALEGAKP
jgi:hypothetical protein